MPADPGGRSLLLALGLAALFLMGWELFWRGTGVGPSPGHGVEIWALRRATLPADAVAMVGTSRIEANVDPEILERRLSRRVVQLAVPGSSPLPVLEDLAGDESFRGSVVVDLVPRVVFDEGGERETAAFAQLAAVEAARRPSSRTEAELRIALRRLLHSQRPELSVTALLTSLSRLRLPTISYATLEANGFRALDFERLDGREREDALLARITASGRPAGAAEKEAVLRRIETSVEALRKRGGSVVFVRMPSDKRIGAFEEEMWPREEYWDVLVERVQAPAIHVEDVPSLSGFDCPDGSHLDKRDVERFSLALARELAPLVGADALARAPGGP